MQLLVKAPIKKDACFVSLLLVVVAVRTKRIPQIYMPYVLSETILITTLYLFDPRSVYKYMVALAFFPLKKKRERNIESGVFSKTKG